MDYDHLSTFSEEMATASKAQISSAQETMINAMGMTLDGGAGTAYSKQDARLLSSRLGRTGEKCRSGTCPWSEDADVFRLFRRSKPRRNP